MFKLEPFRINIQPYLSGWSIAIIISIIAISIFVFQFSERIGSSLGNLLGRKIETMSSFKSEYYKKTDPVNYKTFWMSNDQHINSGKISLFPDEPTPGVKQRYFARLNLPNIRGNDYKDTGMLHYNLWGSEEAENPSWERLGKIKREGDGFYTLVIPATKQYKRFIVTIPAETDSEELKYIILDSN